jgi:haloalkane dehalogenase
LRREEVGEAQVLDENVFVEQLFNQTVLTELSDADLEAYREPYPTRDSRCPLLEWSRAMPLGMNRPTLSAALQACCRHVSCWGHALLSVFQSASRFSGAA